METETNDSDAQIWMKGEILENWKKFAQLENFNFKLVF